MRSSACSVGRSSVTTGYFRTKKYATFSRGRPITQHATCDFTCVMPTKKFLLIPSISTQTECNMDTEHIALHTSLIEQKEELLNVWTLTKSCSPPHGEACRAPLMKSTCRPFDV